MAKKKSEYGHVLFEPPKFDEVFSYWANFLYQKCISLFSYCDSSGKKLPLLSDEIRQRLVRTGECGIVDLGKKDLELTAVYVAPSKQTNYYDRFSEYTFSSPHQSGSRTVGKNIAIILNASNRRGMMPLINFYADQLTHLSLTLKVGAINMREPLVTHVAGTDKECEVLRTYRTKIYNGEFEPLVDKGFVQMETREGARPQTSLLPDTFETLQNVLYSFYRTIGIRTGIEKKGNAIIDEVQSDFDMLSFNVDDMLHSQQEGVDMIKSIWKDFDINVVFNGNIHNERLSQLNGGDSGDDSRVV